MKKLLVTLTTAGLATAMLTLAPGTAHAACDEPTHPFVQTGLTPETVVVGIARSKTVAVNATTTVPCGTLGIHATVGGSANGPSVNLAGVEDKPYFVWTGTITVTPSDLDNTMAGNVDTTFVAYAIPDEDEVVVEEQVNRHLHLYRAARLSVNASPEPVRKGHTITVTGTLERANWDEGVYQGYRNRSVRLMFRTKGGSYAPVASVTSGPGGRVRATVKADVDGYYTWDYTGNSTTGPARPAGDYVDVR